MSDATYYNSKSKYSGMTVSDFKKLKTLEDENRRLKQIVAEQALDTRALKDLLSKNFGSPRRNVWRFRMPGKVLG
jgi:putative transposase